MKNIKKNIIKKIYDELKMKTLKNITGNLGDIYETDDRYVCYVEQERLDWFYYKNKSRVLNLKGIDINDSENIKVKLDKPIYYVFEGIIFRNKLNFNAIHNPYIIFSNCIFNKSISSFFTQGTVKFKSNIYISNWYDMFLENNYLDIHHADSLIFEDDNILNMNKKNLDGKLGIDIKANNVAIRYSNVKITEPSVFYIKAKNLSIDYSIINVDKMIIEADNIHNTSYIKCKDLMIDNKNNDVINYIHADNILYNNVILKDEFEDSDKEENSTIDMDLVKKQELKLHILEILKKLKDECELIKKEELNKKEQELSSTEISKILKY